MSKVSIETIKIVQTPVSMRYSIKDAILFGSFAKGSATERSDVDLLVESNLRNLRLIIFLRSSLVSSRMTGGYLGCISPQKGSRIDCEIRETGIMIYQRP